MGLGAKRVRTVIIVGEPVNNPAKSSKVIAMTALLVDYALITAISDSFFLSCIPCLTRFSSRLDLLIRREVEHKAFALPKPFLRK